MKKIILRKIIIGSIGVLIATALCVMLLQAFQSVNRSDNTADIRIKDSIVKLDNGDVTIEELKSSLNEEFLSKARSFSEMISLNPSMIESAEELEKIKKLLDVDELHITDENGIIQWGTVPGYFGFDMGSSDQSKPFMKMITDPNFELAQEAQPNGAEGTLFQYVGVARRDVPGIVQIGMKPTRLSNALANNTPQMLLKDISVGTSGRMFAVSKADMTVCAFMDESVIGSAADEIGLSSVIGTKGGANFSYKGSTYRCTYGENASYYVGAMVPMDEVNGQVFMLTLSITIIIVIGIAILAFIVNRAVDKNIVSGVTEITGTISKIEQGQTDLRLGVDTCDEFKTLSGGINRMLDTIQQRFEIDEANNEKLKKMVSEISSVSDGINTYSDQMMGVSREISDGSSSQAASIEELAASFTKISDDVSANAAESRKAAEAFAKTKTALDLSSEKMACMQASMQEISNASLKINDIVKTIDDIAFQTNILALNASVEAARAGEQGKGFAVVADEVRNLANKSAEAANRTTDLIKQAIEAVKDGIGTADSAAAELNGMLGEIESNAERITKISEITEEQAVSIKQAANGMKKISEVVRNNSKISSTAEGTSEKLYSEARKLIDIIDRA